MPRMTNTVLLAGPHDPEEIIRSVQHGIFAKAFGGGQVDIANGDFVFSLTESYLIEDGKLTAPLKGANLIGNGPETLRRVVMLGHDVALSEKLDLWQRWPERTGRRRLPDHEAFEHHCWWNRHWLIKARNVSHSLPSWVMARSSIARMVPVPLCDSWERASAPWTSGMTR